jgi:hypothetical protein
LNDSSWVAKANRAALLKEELSENITEFLEQFPPTLQLHQGEGLTYSITVHFTRELPSTFSTILGDLIHNYRSALDSATFALVEAHALGKEFKVEDVKFPIFLKREYFAEGKWHQKILPNEVVSFFEGLQPFSWAGVENSEEDNLEIRKGHPLARLQEISNSDKHRLIKFLYVYLGMFSIHPIQGSLKSNKFVRPQPWKNGDKIYEFELSHAGEVFLNPEFKIALEQDVLPAGIQDLENLLGAIYGQVRHAIGGIEHHLGLTK